MWPRQCPLSAPLASGASVGFVPVSFHRCPAAFCEAVSACLARRGLTFEHQGAPAVHLVWGQHSDVQSNAAEESTTVVVLEELSIESYANALATGADGVVHVDASSDMIVDAIEAAVHGAVILPRQVARSLASEVHRRQPRSELSESDLSLLRAISAGHTVTEIANERFFSERTVRRHLQGVYIKLGVQNRAEAIAAATRIGIND